MELDDMKSIWQNPQNQARINPTAMEMLNLLHKTALSPIARMRRNLNRELLAVLLSYSLAAIIFFQAWQGELSAMSWLHIGLALFYLGYYFRKRKLLAEMEDCAVQVKPDVEHQLYRLRGFVRFYLVSGTLLVPFIALFFLVLSYFRTPGMLYQTIYYPSAAVPFPLMLLIWVLLLGVLTFLLYRFNKRYVNRLYGRHMAKLESLVAELNS